MSAWIVESGHIDVLVSAMIEYGIIEPDKAQDVGQDLWRENHRSVNYRYSERTPTPTYRPALASEPLHPQALFKATGCYHYQTCEHPQWQSSEAKRLVDALEEAIGQRHPELVEPVPSAYGDGMVGSYHDLPVYKAAPWGFSKVEQAYASAY